MHEMRIDDVEIISMLTPSDASASNISAATPGWLFIPAPTSEILAMSPSVENRNAPTSFTTPDRRRSNRGRSSRGTVKETSVFP